MTYLAIDIGGTKTAVAIIDNETIVESSIRPSPSNATTMKASICAQVASLRGLGTAQACGIGFGGQFDFASQQVIRSVHVPGWDGFPLTEWAEQKFVIRAVADNDANVGALGEVSASAGHHGSSVVYLTISTGIGGAILLDRTLQRGAHSLSAEFGHLTLDPLGPQCGCGLYGCAERLLSGLWLQRDHDASPEILFTNEQFRHTYADRLASLLRQISLVIDPDYFILGGGIGALAPNLAGAAQAALTDQLRSWNRPTPQVRTAVLGRNSVLIGAAQLAKERYGSS